LYFQKIAQVRAQRATNGRPYDSSLVLEQALAIDEKKEKYYNANMEINDTGGYTHEKIHCNAAGGNIIVYSYI